MTALRLALAILPLLALAAAPARPVPKARAAPAGSPGSWLSDDDYPKDALRQEIDGTTAFRLTIDKTGVPRECAITTSSGSASLDNATCAKLMERARFTPARDAKGRPAADTYDGRITWRLPDGDAPARMPPVPYMMRVTFYVNEDGSASDCVATVNGEPGPPQICADTLTRRYPVQRDATGKPVRTKLRAVSGIEKAD
jgi:protein TonB